MKTENTCNIIIGEYEVPHIEIIKIETEQNILGGSNLPPNPGDGGDL